MTGRLPSQPRDLCWLLVCLQMAEGSPKVLLCDKAAANTPILCKARSFMVDVPMAKHPGAMLLWNIFPLGESSPYRRCLGMRMDFLP